ncbi:MAG: hypothetical protein GDA48_20785 [Hormoscilla sp. GM102CHS1]|nr:hypothetical protein [Hormoscilla sp. GM102CHS1]
MLRSDIIAVRSKDLNAGQLAAKAGDATREDAHDENKQTYLSLVKLNQRNKAETLAQKGNGS